MNVKQQIKFVFILSISLLRIKAHYITLLKSGDLWCSYQRKNNSLLLVISQYDNQCAIATGSGTEKTLVLRFKQHQ